MWGAGVFDSLVQFVVTGFAIYGGYYGGAKLLKKELEAERTMRREEQKELKSAVVKSIITEMSDIKSVLDRGLTGKRFVQDGSIAIKYISTLLITDSFDSSVFSGYYQMLKIETQRHLSWYFRGCKRMNKIGEQLEYREFHKKEAIGMEHNIKYLFEAMKIGHEKTISVLQSELDEPFEIKLIRKNPS